MHRHAQKRCFAPSSIGLSSIFPAQLSPEAKRYPDISALVHPMDLDCIATCFWCTSKVAEKSRTMARLCRTSKLTAISVKYTLDSYEKYLHSTEVSSIVQDGVLWILRKNTIWVNLWPGISSKRNTTITYQFYMLKSAWNSELVSARNRRIKLESLIRLLINKMVQKHFSVMQWHTSVSVKPSVFFFGSWDDCFRHQEFLTRTTFYTESGGFVWDFNSAWFPNQN